MNAENEGPILNVPNNECPDLNMPNNEGPHMICMEILDKGSNFNSMNIMRVQTLLVQKALQ